MKTPFPRFSVILMAVFFSAIAGAGSAAEPSVTAIYNGRSGLLPGWSSVVWGNLTIESSKTAVKQAGGASLLVTPTATASPYAGLQLVAGDTGGIVLSDAARKGGEVRLYLRNGSDLAGKPAADQAIQIMLSFQADGGAAINGKYEQVVLDPAPADAKSSAGWQLVKISIPRQMPGSVDPAAPVKLRGVYLQYIEQPQESYFVGECLVASSSAQ